METLNWRRVEEVFHAALERPAEGRRSFLDEACRDDSTLRREVESLLSSDARAGSFLEGHAAPAQAPLTGAALGHYRIHSLLAAGGMGEVYRAHDEKLGRDVAIKTISPDFARDAARLERFRREARALASLNHPNVAAIYGLEESDDIDYLVMELVEGEAPRGPLPLAAALDYASQIAAALQVAHEHGIIHRDLKPANLKVTAQGVVKVLDFGLAKEIWRAEPVTVQTSVSAPGRTADGNILGTPGYMSPEQARGGEVDQRTDIWAFGCVLFELLAGSRAFARATQADTVAAVLEDEPDWQALPPRTPARIRDLLQLCLQKDAGCRLHDIGDARRTIVEVLRGRRKKSAARIRSLAVLPLISEREAEQDYFADAMTEALIAELAHISALSVISRTSAMHYKNTTKRLREIGRELGVDAIVEGSVLRSGERVRITAQLIHAASDRHLWTQTYDRDLKDVLALQSEVARAIADEIQVSLTPREREDLSRARPVNVESHDAFMRGRYHWGRVRPERSIEHFREAIAIDPGNAMAYAGIADAQCMLFGAAMQIAPSAEIAPAARSSALKALELDETLAEPHVTLARVLFWYDRDPVGAERELRRAIELNPNCAMAHFHCGLLFAGLRRSEESLTSFHRALQLDPVSCWNSTIAGWVMFGLGYEEAGIRELQKALDLDPGVFYVWSALAASHADQGRFDQALHEASEGTRLSSGLPLAQAWEAYVLGKAGRRQEAIDILKRLEDLAGERYVPAAARILCYLGIGDLENAVKWCEIGFEQRDSVLPHAAIYRAFRPLDRDPRFRELLRRLGVPE